MLRCSVRGGELVLAEDRRRAGKNTVNQLISEELKSLSF